MPESTYSVYLVRGDGDQDGEQGGKRQVTSPVSGHKLEFYDTGVWLDRETGRNFFPYEQIRTIREQSEDRHETEAELSAEADGDTDTAEETAEG